MQIGQLGVSVSEGLGEHRLGGDLCPRPLGDETVDTFGGINYKHLLSILSHRSYKPWEVENRTSWSALTSADINALRGNHESLTSRNGLCYT